MLTPICPCGKKRLLPVGPESSKILIVGGVPEEEDLNNNMPFSGKRGEILYNELSLVGIQLQKCRICFLRPHLEGDAPCAGDDETFTHCLSEMKDRDGVLVVGADACEILQLGSVSSIAGLQVRSIWIPASAKVIIAVPQPPISDLIGEFRLSLEKFAKAVKEKL